MLEESAEKKIAADISYNRINARKEFITRELRKKGRRVTKQRLMLLDIILNEDCSNCKEIYYIASKKDDGIGMATVYRLLNVLEEIGAVSLKNINVTPTFDE